MVVPIGPMLSIFCGSGGIAASVSQKLRLIGYSFAAYASSRFMVGFILCHWDIKQEILFGGLQPCLLTTSNS